MCMWTQIKFRNVYGNANQMKTTKFNDQTWDLSFFQLEPLTKLPRLVCRSKETWNMPCRSSRILAVNDTQASTSVQESPRSSCSKWRAQRRQQRLSSTAHLHSEDDSESTNNDNIITSQMQTNNNEMETSLAGLQSRTTGKVNQPSE